MWGKRLVKLVHQALRPYLYAYDVFAIRMFGRHCRVAEFGARNKGQFNLKWVTVAQLQAV
jgi:hypothetical protein